MNPSHPVSVAVTAEAARYLAVIDHVLAMDYITPDLRRRVISMQRRLIQADIDAHHPALAVAQEPI